MTADIQFPILYLSAPHECPYRSNEVASSLLIDPSLTISDQLFSQALETGFRRSSETVYRPHCTSCHSCISVKINVNHNKLNRSQKRTLKRNQDVRVEFIQPLYDERHFQLYCRYQAWKHPGDSMDHNDRRKYEESMVRSSAPTIMLEFYLENRLIAVAVVDVVSQGLSAVYTFFSPSHAKRSLGRFAVLTLINKARELGLDYVYLGYWIRDCAKMNYKAEYKSLLAFVDNQWVDFSALKIGQ